MAIALLVALSSLLTPPAPAAPRRALDVVSELFRRVGGSTAANAPVVAAVKADLLQTLAEYGVPARSLPPSARQQVETLCTQLESYNPTPRAATSGVAALDGDWCVRYSDAPPPSNGMLGPFAGDARQIVDAAARTYENRLDLGPLTVSLFASFTARDDSSLRVRFDTLTPSLFGIGPPPIRFPEGTERTWLLTYTEPWVRHWWRWSIDHATKQSAATRPSPVHMRCSSHSRSVSLMARSAFSAALPDKKISGNADE